MKKKIFALAAAATCLIACIVFSVVAFAEEFTEADKQIFGIFPIWLFLLMLAGITMVTIIIIVEIFKRKQK